MRPPKKEYEKIPTGIEVLGVISNVEYDNTRKFKGFDGKPDYTAPAIRFKFMLDGCQYEHSTRWMKFNVGSQSNLYAKYLVNLIENAVPDMDFDLDILKGLPIVTVWKDNGDFQNLESISTATKLKIDQGATLPEVNLDSPAPAEGLIDPELESAPF